MLQLENKKASEVLSVLYADAHKNDPLNWAAMPKTREPGVNMYQMATQIYMPVDAQFGQLMLGLIQSVKPDLVVEFGLSMGISTIFLAAGVKANGKGRVITTEFVEEKAQRAKKNLESAGVADVVEIRVGDALQTLKENITSKIGFIFLDGEKSLYLKVLKVLEPHMTQGCIIAADNTDHDGLQDFLKYVRDSANGYISSAVETPHEDGEGRPHEISIRL